MARKYNVEGTKNFLIAGIICLALGVWHVRDGWWTPEKFLEKYPLGTESFYAYNQITGVAFCIAAIVCFYIHKVVK